MHSYDSIFHSKNIHELNLLLGKELQNIQSDNATPVEMSFIEQVPLLIQKLYLKEINSTSSGIKRLRISKEAAESSFSCFQLAINHPSGKSDVADLALKSGKSYLLNIEEQNVLKIKMESEFEALREKFNTALREYLRKGEPLSEESMRAQRYCFIIAEILNLDLSKLKIGELTYIPPLKIGLNEKKEYNRIAILLNREIEKRRLQEYANEIGMLSSSESLLVSNEDVGFKNDLINYQRIIKVDYPAFSDQELNYLIGRLKFQAEVMKIKLTDEQLGLQEEIPIFGINNETLKTIYQKKETLSTQEEIKFYKDLILYDLMTQYMKISTILPSLLPVGVHFESIVFSENNSPSVKLILEQKQELESALAWCSYRPPSIEHLENLLGEILAINEDHSYFKLSKEELIDQKPIMFSTVPKVYNRHINLIEQKIKYLELVKEIMFGSNKERALIELETVEPTSRHQIDEMFNKYDGKAEELQIAIDTWLNHFEFVKLIFTNKELEGSSGWHEFFIRGFAKPKFD